MNNIQKAFKMKSKLRCMADGGVIRGKGGPTDDKVGPVMLSNGEYVLPADTVKIVGRENLDALRLATHNFANKNSKPNASKLRKMADGGIFYVDSKGVASRGQMPPNRALVPYQPLREPIDVAPEGSSLRSAVNSGGGRLGSFVRGALPVAALAGVVDSFSDTSTGYRDRFNESIGATGPVSSVVGDAVRVLSNVGNAVTFGLAGRLGRGIAEAAGGGSFVDGFLSQSDRDRFNNERLERVFNNQEAPRTVQPSQTVSASTQGGLAGVRTSSAGMPALPVDPQSYQSRRLAEMGVPVGQQNLPPVTEDTRRNLLRIGGGTPGQYVNLGSYGGNANIYGTTDKPGGRINTFVGVGNPSRSQEDPTMSEIRSALRDLSKGSGTTIGGSVGSNASAINARFDNLAKELRQMYGPKGQGNLARRLLELEQLRTQALDADARNQSALRGQNINALTSANNANLQARMQALQTLSSMANQRNQQIARSQADMLKALQEAQTFARQNEEKGFERYNKAISSMFIGPDGKPDVAEQERFTSFLQASDPRAAEKFTSMSPQEQMVLLQNFKTLYDMQKARNRTAKGSLFNGGAVTNRADMPVDVREATWNDVWNNGLPFFDYVQSKFWPANPNVVVLESGQVVPMSEIAVDEEGNWDADKLKLIEERTGKDRNGRSILRRE